MIDEFATRAIGAMEPPRAADFMATLDFECRRASGAIIGHEPDDDGMALAQHVMLALRIDGDIRAGIRTAFLWYAEKILANEMDTACVHLRDALLGRPYGPA
ncbi:hypothetical protein [Paraburkholderia heleia]|uniref:hypothetical protein n=1 Tax=Paraburkholderia heleia TaxID=634127 RepID=UPI0012EDBCCA|nr:hypothetical protein [Paraburkholderia heleia]